jgi:PAS domain S-box-containing protein
MINKNLLKILFVEDLPSDVELAVLELRKEGLRFEHMRVDTRDEFIKALNEFKPDIIISDYMMPSYSGMRALIDARELDPLIPFILYTGSMNEETAVDCIKAGATDYIIKEHMTRLPFAIKEALEKYRIQIEKKAAELLLKENEEKLQSIFSAAPVGIGLVVDRVFLEVNDTFCKMTGYDRKELIGKNAEKIYAKDEQNESAGIVIYRHIAEKGTGSVETHFKCKDGRVLNIFLSSIPLDKNDLTKGVTFIAMDITERVQAEEALANEKYLIYSLMNTLPDHIYFKDLSSRFIRINKAQAQFFGLSDPSQAIGKKDSDFFTDEHAQQAYEDEQKIIQTGHSLNIEEKETHPNRPDTWVSTVKLPLHDKDGNTIGTFGISRDITKRKMAEAALQESQHLFQTLAQVSPVGIFRTNPDGYTTYVNPKWLELSGLTSEEAIGLGWLKAVHPDDREKLEGGWNSAVQSQRTSADEYRFLRSDGSIVWVMGNAVPEWIDNKIVGYIGTITDITDRKQAEEVLRESESSLQDAQEMAKMGSWEWDMVTQKTNWSNNYFSIHGFTPAEVEPSFELFRNRIHPDDVHFLDETHAKIMKDKTPSGFELRLIYTDGTVKWIQNNISPVIEDGKLVKLKGVIIDITERKQAEEALVESESKYRHLVTRSPDGIFIVDLSGKFISLNTAICDNLKYTEEELLSMKLWDIVPEKYHSLHKQRLIAIMNGVSTNASAEYEVIGKDGIAHSVEVLSVPYYKGKEIVGFQGIARDITERKKSEDILRSSEERLKILFDYAPDAYYLNDLKGTFVDGNIACEKLMGYNKNELIGKNFLKLNLLSLKQLPRAAKLLIKNSLGQATGPDEFELNRKDGSKVTVEIITHPVKIKDQTLVLGMARDISGRKQAEKALRESEEKYRGIFENVQDVYYETSIDGTILEVSPSIEILSKGQYKMDDLIGKSMFDFYSESKERQALLAVLQERLTVTDFEITLKNRDGSHIPCSISSKMCLDVQGRPEKIIGSLHNITDRKNATEKLKLAKEKAEASDKLKTTFLNNISHEVRTPLNGILGFAEIISQTDLSEEEKKDSFSMLFESSDRLLKTITNYMDISLITSGNLSVHKKDFIPGQALREIFNNYKTLCSNRKLELLLKIPEQTDNLFVNSDPEIFRKILSHLLDNAIKFTEKGSISFGFKIHEGQFEFFVKDTGIGIGKESINNIFDHFVKEDRGPSLLSEGSGLGLSIAKGMVEIIGGNIHVVSEIGVGSCFSFTIPLMKEIEITPSVSTSKENKKVRCGGLILVAEDDQTNFSYLKNLFIRETDVKVLHASNGREAIELFKANPGIILILMDIKMPEIDGLEATRQIKAINRNVPVIAITAYAMSGDEARVLAAGCDGYLAKPVNKKLLLKKMAEFIKI